MTLQVRGLVAVLCAVVLLSTMIGFAMAKVTEPEPATAGTAAGGSKAVVKQLRKANRHLGAVRSNVADSFDTADDYADTLLESIVSNLNSIEGQLSSIDAQLGAFANLFGKDPDESGTVLHMMQKIQEGIGDPLAGNDVNGWLDNINDNTERTCQAVKNSSTC